MHPVSTCSARECVRNPVLEQPHTQKLRVKSKMAQHAQSGDGRW